MQPITKKNIMNKHKTITLVKGAIHNPQEPRHYMTITKSDYHWYATIGNHRLAESSESLKLKEVGHHIYDSVIYFPRDCVNLNVLKQNTKTTTCPLKGSTRYFDFVLEEENLTNVAWTYENTIQEDSFIKNLIAFDPRKVQIERTEPLTDLKKNHERK